MAFDPWLQAKGELQAPEQQMRLHSCLGWCCRRWPMRWTTCGPSGWRRCCGCRPPSASSPGRVKCACCRTLSGATQRHCVTVCTLPWLLRGKRIAVSASHRSIRWDGACWMSTLDSCQLRYLLCMTPSVVRHTSALLHQVLHNGHYAVCDPTDSWRCCGTRRTAASAAVCCGCWTTLARPPAAA